MRCEQLDLNLLVALDVLLEEKNITRTAEKLHLSQSATSSILARLRQYFEDDLLVQVGRKMQPTPYALDLQAPIKEMLNIVRGSITSKRQLDLAQSTRHFRIIASDYIVQVFLADILGDIETLAPNMTFEFLTPFSIETDVLAKGNADLLIVPEHVAFEGYPTARFTTDELVCIADTYNTSISDNVTLQEFMDSGHVTVGFDRASHLIIEKWLVESKSINRRIEVLTNDFTSLCRTLIGSKRLATLPKRFAELQAQHLPLKVMPMPFDTPPLNEHLMWHPTLDSDPTHSWLREQLLKHTQR